VIALLFLLLQAPPPKADDDTTMRRQWGTVVDPKKDCTVKLNGKRLTIAIPGSPHVYDTTDEVFHAPRVLADVSGDFEATVTVYAANLPLTAGAKVGTTPTATAGLLLADADGKYHALVGVERLASRAMKRELTSGVTVLHPTVFRQSGSTPRDADAPDGPVYVRLTRTGRVVEAAVSFDGKAWHAFDECRGDWPAEMRIGVFAAHDTDQAFEAGFEDLKVKKK
jgi:hypothetical protein